NGSTVNRVEMWMATVVNPGQTTITITPTAAFGNTDEVSAIEFTDNGINNGSSWNLEYQPSYANTSSGSSTVTYPNETNFAPTALYVGYAQVQNPPASAGATSGFTYRVTGQSNLMAYNTSLAQNQAFSPTGNQNSSGSANAVGGIISFTQGSANLLQFEDSSGSNSGGFCGAGGGLELNYATSCQYSINLGTGGGSSSLYTGINFGTSSSLFAST